MPPPARPTEPFAPLAPLLKAVAAAPFPPVFFVSGDDDWIVTEARRRLAHAFRAAIPEGEVSEYDGNVREAVDDAATVALFATNRLVLLNADELFRARKVTAEELDALLDDAADATDEKAKRRLSRKAWALASSAGHGNAEDPQEIARKLAGRVKRADRAPELAALLSREVDEGEERENALDRLVDYVSRATPGDNVLVVTAVSPDPEHRVTELLRKTGRAARLDAPTDEARRERLASLGLERALERRVVVEPEVFDTLLERGRLAARPFLSELDRLIDSSPGPRVTAEMAARLIADERKEYGSDFVEAVTARKTPAALQLLDRLLSGGAEFAAFRPFGEAKESGAAPKKAPRGEAAFFPLLGLLTGDVRRMLILKAALHDRAAAARRLDYRSFTERVLPALKTPKAGQPPALVDGHPFALHKAYLASLEWTLPELTAFYTGLARLDRGVKTGEGSGRELLESLLLRLARTA